LISRQAESLAKRYFEFSGFRKDCGHMRMAYGYDPGYAFVEDCSLLKGDGGLIHS